jgi:general stress protein 26
MEKHPLPSPDLTVMIEIEDVGDLMDLKDRILEVIGGEKVAAVATISSESGKTVPAVRFMAVFGLPDLSLAASTFKGSRKVSQLSRNPYVALSIWSGKSFADPYVVINAKAEIHEDLETKKKFWKPMLEKYFGSPENPQYVVLKFVPETIEYTTHTGMEVWKK